MAQYINNEAPEKIYRTTTYLNGDRGKTLWKTKPVAGAENIEYTRTDSFIEKACEWLKNSTYGYLIEKWGETDIDREELAVDFANYMKGE